VAAVASIIRTLWNWANSAYSVAVSIIATLTSVVQWIWGMPAQLGSIAGKMWTWLTQGLSDAANWVLARIEDMINGIISAFNRLPGPNIGTVTMPRVGGPPGGGTAAGMTNPRAGRAAGGLGGGLLWVGENGPDLAHLGPGSHVVGAGESQRRADREGDGRPQIIHVNLVVDGRTLAEVIRPVVQKDFGGDVQAALGWSR
jgi:hypothetical protein